MKPLPIPIAAARRIAESYGYDQVIVVARKVGTDGLEHCTTYGVDKANCAVAARIGDFFKYNLMGWKQATHGRFLAQQWAKAEAEVERVKAIAAAQCLTDGLQITKLQAEAEHLRVLHASACQRANEASCALFAANKELERLRADAEAELSRYRAQGGLTPTYASGSHPAALPEPSGS